MLKKWSVSVRRHLHDANFHFSIHKEIMNQRMQVVPENRAATLIFIKNCLLGDGKKTELQSSLLPFSDLLMRFTAIQRSVKFQERKPITGSSRLSHVTLFSGDISIYFGYAVAPITSGMNDSLSLALSLSPNIYVYITSYNHTSLHDANFLST